MKYYVICGVSSRFSGKYFKEIQPGRYPDDLIASWTDDKRLAYPFDNEEQARKYAESTWVNGAYRLFTYELVEGESFWE